MFSIITKSKWATAIWVLAILLGTNQDIWATGAMPEGFDSVRQLTLFAIYTAIVFCGTMSLKGSNNLRMARAFTFCLGVEWVLYYGLHGALHGLYSKAMIGVIVASPLFLYATLRVPATLWFCRLVALKGPAKYRMWAMRRAAETFDTNLSIHLRFACKLYLMLEIGIALYVGGYIWWMGIPDTGSLWATIDANQHWDYYIAYGTISDLISIYFCAVLLATVHRDRSHPDELGYQTSRSLSSYMAEAQVMLGVKNDGQVKPIKMKM